MTRFDLLGYALKSVPEMRSENLTNKYFFIDYMIMICLKLPGLL